MPVSGTTLLQSSPSIRGPSLIPTVYCDMYIPTAPPSPTSMLFVQEPPPACPPPAPSRRNAVSRRLATANTVYSFLGFIISRGRSERMTLVIALSPSRYTLIRTTRSQHPRARTKNHPRRDSSGAVLNSGAKWTIVKNLLPHYFQCFFDTCHFAIASVTCQVAVMLWLKNTCIFLSAV